MPNQKFIYIELSEGEKVIRRQKTSLASEAKDRRMMMQFQKEGQTIGLVVSSVKEKIIN
jgi:hypothetical protein